MQEIPVEGGTVLEGWCDLGSLLTPCHLATWASLVAGSLGEESDACHAGDSL